MKRINESHAVRPKRGFRLSTIVASAVVVAGGIVLPAAADSASPMPDSATV
ncbi:hypothetical protein [Streptomyces diastatochromogenes]|uniref:hypothetical protein n=1 Tax=Streptomyces diastatochromogenes TaxID=42236 RepID=UPI0036990225